MYAGCGYTSISGGWMVYRVGGMGWDGRGGLG